MAAGLSISLALTITPFPSVFFFFSYIWMRGCYVQLRSISLKHEGYVPLYSVSKSVNMSPIRGRKESPIPSNVRSPIPIKKKKY
jgi:hypothetical protein